MDDPSESGDPESSVSLIWWFYIVWLSVIWGQMWGPAWVHILWPRMYYLPFVFDIKRREALERMYLLRKYNLHYQIERNVPTAVHSMDYDPKKILNSDVTYDGFTLNNIIKSQLVYPKIDFNNITDFNTNTAINLFEYADLEHELLLKEGVNIIQYTILRIARSWLCENEFIDDGMNKLLENYDHFLNEDKLSAETIMQHTDYAKEHMLLVTDLQNKRELFIKYAGIYMKAIIKKEFEASYYCKDKYTNIIDLFLDEVISECFNFQMLKQGPFKPVKFPCPPLNYNFSGMSEAILPKHGFMYLGYFRRYDYYITIQEQEEPMVKKDFYFSPDFFYSDRQAWVPGKFINPYYELDYTEEYYKHHCELYEKIACNIRSNLDVNDRIVFDKLCYVQHMQNRVIVKKHVKTFCKFIDEDYRIIEADVQLEMAFNDLRCYAEDWFLSWFE